MPLKQEELSYPASNGKDTVKAQIWYEEGTAPRCVLQIVHGMCEYVERYSGFAAFLAKNGLIVCGNDLAGHGKSKGENGYGYFGDKDGDRALIEDVHALNQKMRERWTGLPVILLGHSMGSFIARDYITRYGETVSGVILSGTSGDNPMLGFGLLLTGFLGLFFGKKHRSRLLAQVAFGKYNQRYPEKRTAYDWISRDTDVVDRYAADEACTFLFTVSAYRDMLRILKRISGDAWARKVPKEKPYCLISGTMDPVGGYTRGVRQIYDRLKAAGAADVTLRLYEGGHHEMLNEINRGEVYGDLLRWTERVAPAPKQPAEHA